MTAMVHILYPDNRMVSKDTIILWAKDLLVNEVIEHKQYESDNELDADVARIHATEEYRAMDLANAIELLAIDGCVTFGR